MKTLILSILINFSVSGAFYKAPISEIEKKINDCDYPLAVLKNCQGECAEVTDQFNCNYSKIVDEYKNDLQNPNYSKSEVVSCLDDVHCQNILEAKVCTDTEESALKNLETLEVYCSKITSYDQIATGRKIIVVDETLKASYEASELAKENLKASREAAIQALKVSAISKDWNALTTPERKILMGLEVTDAELGL